MIEQLKCKYINEKEGIVMVNIMNVYLIDGTKLIPESYRGSLYYRLPKTAHRLSYKRIKAGLIKKDFIIECIYPF